ncbi:MAG: PIG-L family deacetylase [Chloroflexales bacterium]|nr:PIG-L family deacetylase [Chloroflexales bacterium]
MTEPSVPRSALAVMAHPDDVEFMCGGLIARWARAGVQIHYCLLTDGTSGSRDPDLAPEALAAQRRQEQQAAGELLGVAGYFFLGHPDGRLVPSVALRLEIARVIRQVRPEAVVTSDPRFFYNSWYINHPDHRAAGEATLAAIMPLANTLLAAPELRAEGLAPHDVGEVYLAAPAEPTRFVPLEPEDLERKVAAMRAHTSQVAQFPDFERLLRQMAHDTAAQARGAGVVCAAAESYVQITLARDAGLETGAAGI